MTMFLSYSQNFEDVLLWRALGHVDKGFYVDIGAQDPVIDSVSMGFYERGWRGVHVEPTPGYASALRKARPDETVIEAAVGEGDRLLTLYEIPDTGLSTGVAEIAEKHDRAGFASRRIDVPAISLATLFERYGEREIHWLKIDVEGMETSVLQSWGDSAVRPWIVIVESIVPMTRDSTHDDWEHLLFSRGYGFAYWDGINRFYVSGLHPELSAAFELPPNFFDSFSLAGIGGNPSTNHLNGIIDGLRRESGELAEVRSALATASADAEAIRATAAVTEHALRHLEASHADAVSGLNAELTRLQAEHEQKQAETARQRGVLEAALDDAGRERDNAKQRLADAELASSQRLKVLLEEKESAVATVLQRLADHERDSARNLGALKEVHAEQLEEAERQLRASETARTQDSIDAERARRHDLTSWQGMTHEANRRSEQIQKEMLDRLALLSRDHAESVQALNDRLQGASVHAYAVESELRERLDVQSASLMRLNWMLRTAQGENAQLRTSWWPRFIRSRIGRPNDVVSSGYLAVELQALSSAPRYVGTADASQSFPALPSPATPSLLPTGSNMVYMPVASVDDLLDLQDEAFVRSAYAALLGRSADPDGLAFYVQRIRSGVDKRQIIGELCHSPEATARPPVDLRGLAELLTLRPDEPPGLVRKLARRLLGGALEPVESELRRLGNSLHRNLGGQNERLAAIEAAMVALGTLVASRQEAQVETSRQPDEADANAAPHGQHEPETRRIYYYVDHTVTCPGNTGMQRVVRRLAHALVQQGVLVIFVKWNDALSTFVRIDRVELEHLSRWNGPELGHGMLSAYPDSSMPPTAAVSAARSGDWLLVPEVTHITNQAKPMTLDVITEAHRTGLPVAFVYYDATPLRRPELTAMASTHAEYMSTLLLADLVLPISKWASDDLVSFLKLHQHARLAPSPRILPIALPGESQAVPRFPKHGRRSVVENMVLSVGSIVPHKNQLSLVEAFNRYCRRHPESDWKLYLAGNLAPSLAQQLHDLSAGNERIRYLGEVSDDELADLYQRAAFTVFPSVMEGFGLPILESLWYGVPCVCANFGAMSEVATGGGCMMVDTSDLQALEQALARLIGEPALLERLRNEAVSRPIKTWREYAPELIEVLDQTLDPRAKLGAIYFWIDHTSGYPANSGIQRVVRGLGRALQDLGVRLIPVKWSEERQTLVAASKEDLEHLAKWNGPKPSRWSAWQAPRDAGTDGWLVIAELSHYLARTSVDGIHDYAHAHGLRCAWIFHDALPFKMRDIYPPEATEAHRKYMLALRNADKVLANSQTSRSDLLDFLNSVPERTPWAERRVEAILLPGEFLDTPRTCTPKPVGVDRVVRMLCVGTVEPRKNHLLLLQAFAQARQRAGVTLELTIAGGDPFDELARQVQQRADETPGVRWIRRPDDAALRRLYEDCDFTVYPSLAEGFGLPILESLWFGRPCVCADFGSMAEVAQGGGCFTVDVKSISALADGLSRLATDRDFRMLLAREACGRAFKTWKEYANQVLASLADERLVEHEPAIDGSFGTEDELRTAMPNLERMPALSICISTYNRARWLDINLRNLFTVLPSPHADIEILVCDNASTDDTQEVASRFARRPDFRYVRNPRNVGMLGNLRVTANAARGRYVWILGDDDLIKADAVETILSTIRAQPEVGLIYLNYSYTHEDDPTKIHDLEAFLDQSTPIVPASPDVSGTVREICTQSENFFTAIYCLVFRRDHAIRAYSQNTSGRPFSTLLTCIPTTYYVLGHMMDEPAHWIGKPLLVVNMNVSWMRYASLWILERIPEVYDFAERRGADAAAVDRWRVHNLPGLLHFFSEIFAADPENNAEYVSISRVLGRFKHLPEFKEMVPKLKAIYSAGHDTAHRLAHLPPDRMFAAFQ